MVEVQVERRCGNKYMGTLEYQESIRLDDSLGMNSIEPLQWVGGIWEKQLYEANGLVGAVA